MGNFFEDLLNPLSLLGGGGSSGSSSSGSGGAAALGALVGASAADDEKKPFDPNNVPGYSQDPNTPQGDSQFNQMRRSQMGMGVSSS